MDADPATWGAAQSYRFLCSFVSPRPIAWVTTVGRSGVVNAAPFSWYNAIQSDPPMVLIAVAHHRDGRLKDTARNAIETGEFVVNLAVRELAGPMVATSADYAPEESEVEALALATSPSATVRPPRLAQSPAHLECRLDRHLEVGRKGDVTLLFGAVQHVHAEDAILGADGAIDAARAVLVARMGGAWYCTTEDPFEIPRPRRPLPSA